MEKAKFHENAHMIIHIVAWSLVCEKTSMIKTMALILIGRNQMIM